MPVWIQLDSNGWEVNEGNVVDNEQWMNMFQILVEYKKKEHTNTMVPKRHVEDPKLGEWVSKQRCHYKNDKLLPNHRYARLNSVGFK